MDVRFFVALIVGLTSLSSNSAAQIDKQLRAQEEEYFFSVTAIFKNEALSIREWVEHYIAEGVDHIYLVDNNSSDTDDSRSRIADYVEQGRVTLFWDPTPHFQDGLYTRLVKPLFPLTKWMVIVDLDEFMYGRNESIAEYLKRVPEDVGRLEVPWKMFGSSGHIKQPNGVVENFVWRTDWNSKYHEFVKSIFRTAAAGMIHHHQTRISPEYKVAYPLYDISSRIVTEDISIPDTDFALHLNHYPIQSKDWFIKVKVQRGDAVHARNARDEPYFLEYDKNMSIFDYELRRKHRARKHVRVRVTAGKH